MELAPPTPKSCTEFAPPIEDLKTPYGSKDQKPSGVLKKSGGEESLPAPTLKNVLREDLEQFSRTEALYHEAVGASVVRASEASLLNWVAAAIRAKTVSSRDTVRVFLGIVKKGLYHHITHEQEERARRAVLHYKEVGCNPEVNQLIKHLMMKKAA